MSLASLESRKNLDRRLIFSFRNLSLNQRFQYIQTENRGIQNGPTARNTLVTVSPTYGFTQVPREGFRHFRLAYQPIPQAESNSINNITGYGLLPDDEASRVIAIRYLSTQSRVTI